MLLLLMLGGLGKAWGQWSGANYTDDLTIDMTGDVTMTGVIFIDNCTVTINPNGASRTINIGDPQAVFYFANGGVLKIEGTSSQTITIDCNNISNIFPVVYCYDAKEIDFDYVTIKNANGESNGSAIYLRNGTANLNHCKFYDNSTTGEGGAIYLSNTSTLLNCTDCEFMRNSAGTEGGAIKTYAPVTLIDCIFTGNTANYGGALYMYSTSANVNCNGCSFSSNSATNGGGAIYASSNPTLNLTDCTITGNSSNNNYGGVFNGCTSMTVSGLVVINGNTATNNYPNVYYAATKWIEIGADGLDCGSSIGVSTYQASNPYNIALVRGSAANCLDAYRNHYFFCDVLRYKPGSDYVIINGSEVDVLYYDYTTAPYSGCLKFVDKTTSNGWLHYADASGCTISGGYVTQVNTAAGLAYLAKDIASGRNYSGKTVLLTADLNMAGHNWEPIGSACSDRAFCGTFNGQGHSISGLSSTLLYDNMGVFGYVGSGGTVKNLIVSNTISATSATNLGGIAGELDGGSVYNCISTVTLSGGTNRGALVGKVTSGSLLNSFAISNDAACGSGTVTNCYVRKVSGGSASNMGTATNVGASGNTTGAFTETVTPYLYNHADNKVGSTALLTLLNAWVDAQSSPNDYARWTRTMASPINGDYPLLMLPGTKCVGTKSGNANVLNYGSSFNTMLGTHNASGDNIFLYASETGVNTGNGSANVYIAEDVALLHTSAIANAHVGITLDPTNGTEGVHWHMFSPALSNAPLGITYPANGSYTPAYGTLPAAMQPTLTGTGYFPATDYSGNSYYSEWDFYTYFEPQYHWINFKRNSDNHWHEDSNHENIAYTNESTLTPGRGYLVATDDECLLEASGTLNPADGTSDVTIPVTRQAAYRTGYNLLGNPYQAYLDFDAFADVNKALWGGTKANASYLILDKDGYTYYAYSGSANTITANQYLHPHQGFMIVATASGTATFTNGMRSTTAAAFRGEHVDYPLVNLIATEEDGNRDITTIELGRPEAGGAFKQYNMHLGTGCIYTHYEDDDYAIAFTLPGLSEIGIRFETDEDAAYTLTWDMENGEFSYLHLIDNMTGSDIDCLTATEYRFTSRPSDYKSRFRLVFEYTGIDEPEGDGPSTGSGTFAFMMGNELVVNCGPSTGSGTAGTATLQMFDMTGRLVMEKTVCGTQTTTVLPELTAGVYVLRLSDKNGTKVQKIVIE